MTTNSPFLTDLDTRAAVKGSRDPLGVQSIWTKLGRQVVGNLTTVTTSVRDFTTLLLGYHYAARISEAGGDHSELAVFLKWEQLAAYSRGYVNDDWGFRGVERVKARMASNLRVRLSADSSGQILSNQKTYGLWGLFSVSARSSGLLAGEPARLTPGAADFVQREYLGTIQSGKPGDGRHLLDLLREPVSSVDLDGRDRQLAREVAGMLKPRLRAAEIPFYREYLLNGGPEDSTKGCQPLLARLFDTIGDVGELSPSLLAGLVKAAEAEGELGQTLAFHLGRIRTAESLLAPCAALFDFMLGQNDMALPELAAIIAKQWSANTKTVNIAGLKEMISDLGNNGRDDGEGDRWLQTAQALAAGDYETAVKLLLDQNRAVMLSRGGAPWAVLEKNKLQVRVRDETAVLPALEDLPHLWRHSYFLDSLRAVSLQLKGENA
ncbi:MAG: hypothetical protein WCN95_05560 [bacterium]